MPTSFGLMSTQNVIDIIATTTSNTFTYLNAVLPYLMVAAVVVGVLFFAIRWVKSLFGGHGQRV